MREMPEAVETQRWRRSQCNGARNAVRVGHREAITRAPSGHFESHLAALQMGSYPVRTACGQRRLRGLRLMCSTDRAFPSGFSKTNQKRTLRDWEGR